MHWLRVSNVPVSSADYMPNAGAPEKGALFLHGEAKKGKRKRGSKKGEAKKAKRKRRSEKGKRKGKRNKTARKCGMENGKIRFIVNNCCISDNFCKSRTRKRQNAHFTRYISPKIVTDVKYCSNRLTNRIACAMIKGQWGDKISRFATI